MSVYENLVRPCLFAMDPEKAHRRAVSMLERIGRWPFAKNALERRFALRHPALESTIAGIRFPAPVGLAAGFDKDCRLTGALPALGFGFIELGTITPSPQGGNPKPRIFRVPEARALINRLGFNNDGMDEAAARLRALADRPVPIGLNIGRGRETPEERATEDYRRLFERLAPLADYIVLNVSSPNTPGLRGLQERLRLEQLLIALGEMNAEKKPIFVKLSPDLSLDQLDSLCPVLLQGAQGVVISNTTISRHGVPAAFQGIDGGLSGAPLRAISTRLIGEVFARTEGKLPIIGVGGIFDADDAFEKIAAGASLVQLYTGFVYRGPAVAREIHRGLLRHLSRRGLTSLSQAVGLAHQDAAENGKT